MPFNRKPSVAVYKFSSCDGCQLQLLNLEDEILEKIPKSRINGTADRSKRLPNTSNISFPNINGEAILAKFDR